jgi:hypothetical protein
LTELAELTTPLAVARPLAARRIWPLLRASRALNSAGTGAAGETAAAADSGSTAAKAAATGPSGLGVLDREGGQAGKDTHHHETRSRGATLGAAHRA